MKFAVCLIVACFAVGSISAWTIAETEDEFNDILKNAGDKLVVVDFFATWCGPCKTMAPALEELAKKYESIVTVKINVDNEDTENLVSKYMVSTMPTFVFFKGGKKADFVPGSDVAKVEKAIEKFLPKEQSTDNTNHFITVQTKAEYDEFVSNATNKLVVLYFSSKSCESCQTLFTAVNQLAGKYSSNIIPIEIDVDAQGTLEIVKKFDAKKLPLFAFLKSGRTVYYVSKPTEIMVEDIIKAFI